MCLCMYVSTLTYMCVYTCKQLYTLQRTYIHILFPDLMYNPLTPNEIQCYNVTKYSFL